VCNDEGVCIDPGGGSDGGSGGGTTQDGTGLNKGCGDSDDDGVCNALDQKPEESCSADADDDGCNDSCDADDTDSGDGCFGCRTPHVRRPNSTFWCLLLLAYCRGRRRRQKRTVTP
jgi:hypothetical protein